MLMSFCPHFLYPYVKPELLKTPQPAFVLVVLDPTNPSLHCSLFITFTCLKKPLGGSLLLQEENGEFFNMALQSICRRLSFSLHFSLPHPHPKPKVHTQRHTYHTRPTDWFCIYLISWNFSLLTSGPLSLFNKCSLCAFTVSAVEDTERVNLTSEVSTVLKLTFWLGGWGSLDYWQ